MNNFIPEFIEVLTQDGWVSIKDYNPQSTLLLLDSEYKTGYLKPKVYSKMNYNGPLLEIETDTCKVYSKPSGQLLCNNVNTKAKLIKKGDLINRRFMWHRVENITTGEWQGTMYSLFFGESLFLPLKFEFDYWLHIV
jgi:hypothetical protein